MRTILILILFISVNSIAQIKPGAHQTEEYIKLTSGKRIAIVANQSSLINSTSVVDSLLSLNQNIKKVFSPEHGFRGRADAGEKINDQIDEKTALKIISLYGKNKKPKKEQLNDVDIVIFDLQDVGVRFYTYISTLHYVMEACAENNVELIVLDRPNPNIHYVDGPVLEKKHSSFVGMHEVPVVYGMTIGEYAKMINGEKWLKNGISCELKVIKIENYSRNNSYDLPVKPSPNLPNSKSINLYPSLCLFEGTNVSVGRGTNMQFQVFGSPEFKGKYNFNFTPLPNEGAKHPKNQGKVCYGKDLTKNERLNKLELAWLIEAYNNASNKDEFFNSFFVKLAGSEKLERQIKEGKSEDEIRLSWKKNIEEFKKIRSEYLIYN